MDILFLLVPLSVVLVFAILAGFWWALNTGQLDNVEREGTRILRDEEHGTDPVQGPLWPMGAASVENDQAPSRMRPE